MTDSLKARSKLNEATRIAAGDDGTHYDRVSIGLHWLTAVLVVTQFLLAQSWGLFERPARHVLIVSHMSLGIILSGVIVTRIVRRLMPGHQISSAVVGWVEIASKAVHYLLYVLLLSEVVLGFLLRWSGKPGNTALSFFGWLIPSPFPPFSHDVHEVFEKFHDRIAWAIILLAAGHATAALFHYYVLKDGILSRMLPIAKTRRMPA